MKQHSQIYILATNSSWDFVKTSWVFASTDEEFHMLNWSPPEYPGTVGFLKNMDENEARMYLIFISLACED